MTICQQFFVCKYCFKFINVSKLSKNGIRRHRCQLRFCNVCRKETDHAHNCTIQKYRMKRPDKFHIIFYDIESVQKKEFEVEIKQKTRSTNIEKKVEIWFEHEAILVCAQKVCEQCYRFASKDFPCSHCGQREKIFEGKNALVEFLTYLFEYKSCTRKIICVAHNSRSYDGQLVLNTVLTHFKNVDIDICSKVFKLLRIKLNNYIHFIDSLMFLPMPLAKFAQTFELDVTKGFSPYSFLSFDNWNYKGQIPEKKYFEIDESNMKRVAEFDDWYAEKMKSVYNLRDETILYCSNDVSLLRRGCVKFIQFIMNVADVNPFLECFSLAQCALIIYRKKFMPEGKLGIVPRNNYQMNTAQSKICRKWLTYLNYFQELISTSEHFFIQPEVKLKDCGLVVDGFCQNYPVASSSSSKKGTVFEFEGCYHHCCPLCVKSNPINLQRKSSLNGTKFEQKGIPSKQAYHQTLAKLDRLRELNYNVIHIWEHEWLAFLKHNKELDKQISAHPFVNYSNLKARSAVYGGRTEVGRLYYKCKPGEKMYFYDYTSLYSYAMLTSKYFIGAPTRILRQKECEFLTIKDMLEFDGLAYCTVLPNRELFWPILPYRFNKKLFFPSCRTCLNEYQKEIFVYCTHEEIEKRCITGTWSTDELRLAFENGYQLVKVIEVWHYETERGESQNVNQNNTMSYQELVNHVNGLERRHRSTPGFFTDYQNCFIRIKTEASGFPLDCETDAQKEEYIVNFYRENNIFLRWDNIKRNDTLKNLSKSLLNSLFGKLIERSTHLSTDILHNPQDLRFYLNSDIHEIVDLYCCNDNYVVLNWKMKTDQEGEEIELSPGFPRSEQKTVCLTSGIQTTTNGRVRLYSELKKLKERCFYMDTDSMIFLQRNENEYCPSLSNKIGGLRDELDKFKKKGSDFIPYISEFISLGCKTYALKIVDEPEDSPNFKYKYIIKCKGVSLTHNNAKLITMNLMKSFVLGENYTDNDTDGIFYLDDFITKRKCIRTLKNFRIVTREERKLFRFTFDKRLIGDDLITYPYGYKI